MPFAILPLLTQDRTRSEARCVDFDMGVAVRIIDGQDRAFSEAMFKLVKGRLLLFSLLPWCLAREAIQGFADSAEVLNELSVEVRKTAELSYVQHILRDWPIRYTLHLHQVHLHTVLRDEHAEVLDLGLFELALLWFAEQVSFH